MKTSLNSNSLNILGVNIDPSLAALILVALIIFLVIAIIAYFLYSIALYRIAKKRNFDYPILAWIPITNVYYFGKINDDIKQKQGEESNLRTTFLICYFLIMALYISNLFFGKSAPVVSMIISSCILVVGIVFCVINFICHYTIFKEYLPDSYTLHFALTIISSFLGLPIVSGISLLIASNKKPIS